MIARIFATPLSEFKPFIIMLHNIGGAVSGSQEVYYSIDAISFNRECQQDRQALPLAALVSTIAAHVHTWGNIILDLRHPSEEFERNT